MAIHPLLTRAADLAGVFTVRPHHNGFVVWRLRPWDHDRGGWTPEAYASTRARAEAQILARFPDLKPDDEPQTETPPAFDVIWDGSWFM